MAKKVTSKKPSITTDTHGSFKVRPLGDRVLVRELKKEGEKVVSGIIIPESAGDDRGARKGEESMMTECLFRWALELEIRYSFNGATNL